MKKMIFIWVMLLGFSGFAQTENPEFKTKTIELIELSTGPQFKVMLQPIFTRIPEENKAAFKAEIQKKLDELYEEIAVVYMESYTEDEVDAILEFYNSPVGKKMLEQTPVIMEKSMQIGQQWGMELQPLIMKYSN